MEDSRMVQNTLEVYGTLWRHICYYYIIKGSRKTYCMEDLSIKKGEVLSCKT